MPEGDVEHHSWIIGWGLAEKQGCMVPRLQVPQGFAYHASLLIRCEAGSIPHVNLHVRVMSVPKQPQQPQPQPQPIAAALLL